jgi:hypothetical protein
VDGRNNYVDDVCVEPTIVKGPPKTEKFDVIKREDLERTSRKGSTLDLLIGVRIPASQFIQKLRDGGQ